MLPNGPRLSAPTRDSGPPARPREGLLMMAMPHWREATWRETGDPLRRAGNFCAAAMFIRVVVVNS